MTTTLSLEEGVMDEDETQGPAEDWSRPRERTVPVEPRPWDGRSPETATGDPIDVQDWDYRLWRRA
ncbi:hypothetical protein [Streptomyces sp. NRRL F-5630]|uniref:hypothetical protein n=1 Tax=Streptomyces sp. NRRL F-5630 TaxID=1463864 RepID=UPI003EBA5D18